MNSSINLSDISSIESFREGLNKKSTTDDKKDFTLHIKKHFNRMDHEIIKEMSDYVFSNNRGKNNLSPSLRKIFADYIIAYTKFINKKKNRFDSIYLNHKLSKSCKNLDAIFNQFSEYTNYEFSFSKMITLIEHKEYFKKQVTEIIKIHNQIKSKSFLDVILARIITYGLDDDKCPYMKSIFTKISLTQLEIESINKLRNNAIRIFKTSVYKIRMFVKYHKEILKKQLDYRVLICYSDINISYDNSREHIVREIRDALIEKCESDILFENAMKKYIKYLPAKNKLEKIMIDSIKDCLFAYMIYESDRKYIISCVKERLSVDEYVLDSNSIMKMIMDDEYESIKLK